MSSGLKTAHWKSQRSESVSNSIVCSSLESLHVGKLGVTPTVMKASFDG